MTDRVYIHTNHKQMVGALVARHALKRRSKNPDKFEVQIPEEKIIEVSTFTQVVDQLYEAILAKGDDPAPA